MAAGPRRLGFLLLVFAMGSLPGCAGWALSSGSELDQSGLKVHAQVQVMSLVAETALAHSHPGTVSLQVMLDDAESELTDQESTIASLPAGEPHRDLVLAAARSALRALGELRAALEAHDTGRLEQIRRELEPLARRIEALGMA